MRAVGSKIGVNSYSFRRDAALWETVKLSVCVMLALQYWAVSLLDILEEPGWSVRWWWFMRMCCSQVQAPGSDYFFPLQLLFLR